MRLRTNRMINLPTLDGQNRQFSERSELSEHIFNSVAALPKGDGEQPLREIFLRRYTAEMYNWQRRRDWYRRRAIGIDTGVAILGIASSSIAAGKSSSHSTTSTIALVVIGLLVAVFTAINHFTDLRGTAARYRRDELRLRNIGWWYLRQLEEGTDAVEAYSNFQRKASDVLEREHPLPFASEAGLPGA